MIIIIRIALHLSVIKKANFIPCKVAASFHIWNIIFPFIEKGRNNHKKSINTFANKSALITFLKGRENIITSKKAKQNPTIEASILFSRAIKKAVIKPEISLIRGSIRCIKELPS